MGKAKEEKTIPTIKATFDDYLQTVCNKTFLLQGTNLNIKLPFYESNFMHLTGVDDLLAKNEKIKASQFAENVKAGISYDSYFKTSNLKRYSDVYWARRKIEYLYTIFWAIYSAAAGSLTLNCWEIKDSSAFFRRKGETNLKHILFCLGRDIEDHQVLVLLGLSKDDHKEDVYHPSTFLVFDNNDYNNCFDRDPRKALQTIPFEIKLID